MSRGWEQCCGTPAASTTTTASAITLPASTRERISAAVRSRVRTSSPRSTESLATFASSLKSPLSFSLYPPPFLSFSSKSLLENDRLILHVPQEEKFSRKRARASSNSRSPIHFLRLGFVPFLLLRRNAQSRLRIEYRTR